MADEVTRLTVHVVDGGADTQELERLTAGLRGELLELDILDVAPETGEPPPGARAILSFAVGGLVISLAGMDLLAAVVNAVTAWLQRDQNRSVKLGVDGDLLELTGVPSREQRRLTDEWLRRRAGRAGERPLSGTRMALIVASDEYADPGLRRLRAPSLDAQALARVLGDRRIGAFDVRTMLNETTQDVNEAVEEFFADRDPDDLLLLHFSGHGVKDESGELYFATPTTKLNRLAATAVPAEFVNRRMSRSRSRRIVLLLDCCYAGAFARGALPRAGLGVNVEEQFGGRGRVVITASNAMEYAFDGTELADTQELSPSVFTSALVEGLESGEADRDSDGYVAIDELYDHVYDTVRRTTPSQTPGKWTFDVQGDMYIARRARPVSRPVSLPDELQHAIDHPIAKIRAGAVGELERLRHSRHEGLALAARLALEALADDDSRLVSGAATKALGPEAPAPRVAKRAGGPAEPVGTAPKTPKPATPPPAPAIPASPSPSPSPSPTPTPATPTPTPASPTPAPATPASPSPSPASPTPKPTPPTLTPATSTVSPSVPASPAAGPSRWPVPVRAAVLVAALLLVSTPLIALATPIASIWLALLVTAAVLVGLLPPGRLERDVAIGATFGLAAVYLGELSVLSWARGPQPVAGWVAAAGGVLVLAVVLFETTSAAPGRWRFLDRLVAVLALGAIIAHLAAPEGITRGPGESVTWIATVALAGGFVVLAVLHLVRHVRQGLPWVPMALGLAATLLVTYDLAEVYHLTTGRNQLAAAYQPALLVMLLIAALSARPRPYILAAARLSMIVGLLYGVGYYYNSFPNLSQWGPETLEAAPTHPVRLLVLSLAAVCVAVGTYLSRPSATAEREPSPDPGR
ncbi:caspase, EACC1-associated type [Nonomuraea sp. CA-143628]|uniref:caspase family protein n=1 Tax=Nonomuraea sp. CA-143628 TaxID=3239997 RepID=UPI003D90B7D4